MSIEAMKLGIEALTPWMGTDANHTEQHAAYHALRQAIEQAQKQEPVAWMMLNSHGEEITIPESNLREKQSEHTRKLWENATPLYTSPPQRQWVGLTDDERKDLCRCWSSPMDAIYATERKLKEKNT